MVRTKKVLYRAAFTLIELIFAIIIMSVAIISLPMMMQITADGVEKNIVQEAVFAASAELMGATSYYWDARSMEDEEFSHLSRVIHVGGGVTDCDSNTSGPRYGMRPGHVDRRCLNDLNNHTVNYTGDDATLVGLNASVHVVGDMFDNSDAQASGYKQEYKSSMVIAKGNDINGVSSDNVKVLTISIFDEDSVHLTSLKTYSANIGEVKYYKRKF